VARVRLPLSVDSPIGSFAQAVVLGIAHALAFAPAAFWWLQWLALAGLFALAQRAGGTRAAAWLGFAFGLGWFCTGISWVYISMHVYGHLWAWLAALATLAFAAFLALYPAAALAAAARFVPDPAVRLIAGLPAAWAASEWLRGVVLTGFPWIASGYAHIDGPLAGYAPAVGVYGITLLGALLAAATVAVLRWRQRRRLAVGALLLALAVPAGGLLLDRVAWTQPLGDPVRVRLAQGNIPQDEKFVPGSLERMHDVYMRLITQPGAFDLVALPESVYPLPLGYLPEPVTRDLLDFVRTRKTALVFGIFIEEPERRYFNSAVGLAPGRTAGQRYSKRHLVPFGEFVPFGFRWFVDAMHVPIGDQERGMRLQPPMELAGQRIAVNICYEDLFGAEIIEAWHDPQRAPTILLNLSNLAWFEDSIALPQHLHASRMRARETGRPMLRSTNTGATAIIDARGEVAGRLAYNTADVLDGVVQGQTGDTPFVRSGNLPALGATALLLVLAGWIGRRR
jgi:apolipoprotein N-acyltransferase